MNRRLAASALSALMFAQGLMGFAALAAVVLRDRPAVSIVAEVPAQTLLR